MHELLALMRNPWISVGAAVLLSMAILAIIRRRKSSPAVSSLPFVKEDLIEQWRHTDDGDSFEAGPNPDKKRTVWRVQKITDEYVEMELASGRYEWGFD